MTDNPSKLIKRHNHNHFWIENETVYESYNTLRGLRYAAVANVIMEDKQYLNEEDILRVNDLLEANIEPDFI